MLPKLLVFQVSLAICLVGWLAKTGWGREVRFRSSPLNLPVLLLLGSALISAPATTHPLDTVVELCNLGTLVILFFIVANTITLNRFEPVLWGFTFAGMVVALIGILQYHNIAFLRIPSNALPSATFGNRNLAAEYLICVIPISGFLFLILRRGAGLFVCGLSTTLMGVFLVYTRTRGAWLGAGGAVLFVGGLLAFCPALRRPIFEAVRSEMDRRKWSIVSGFLVLFVLLSSLPPYRDLDSFEGKALRRLPETKKGVVSAAASIFKKESMQEGGIVERLALWRGALDMVGDHPILGVGPGGWIRTYPLYDGGITVTIGGYHRRPHNDYLWIASEYGLLGLGIYIWFLIAGFRCLVGMVRGPDRIARIAAPIFALSLLSLLGAAFVGFPREEVQTALFPYLLFGVAAGATARGPIPGSTFSVGRWIVVIFLAISLGAAELSRRRISFDRHFLRAYRAASVEEWPGVLDEADRAWGFGSFRTDLLFFKGAALQRMRRYPEAERAYLKALALAPNAWYVHDGLGFVYMQMDLFEKALEHCDKALAICPGAGHIRAYLGMIYSRTGHPNWAKKEFKAALAADPEHTEARIFLGNLYLEQGQPDSSIVEYQQALQIDPDLDRAHLNLAAVYQQQERFQEALVHYRKALRTFSENPKVQWGLGTALEAAGDERGAETAYRKAIDLNPEFAQAHFALGNLTYQSGRYKEAQEAYRMFLGFWKGDADFAQFAKDRIARCERRSKN